MKTTSMSFGALTIRDSVHYREMARQSVTNLLGSNGMVYG